MTDKIALVTGGNRGIGLHTVQQLAEKGVQVILAARSYANAVSAALELQRKGLPVEALQLDVTSDASIAAAATEISRRHGRLDILVNNAGIAVAGALPSQETQETWRRVFDTNFFGVVGLTQALLPLLRKSGAGRIVNVSSLLGSLAQHQQPGSPIHGMINLPAYNVSKTALNGWTVQLALELQDTPIKVNTIHPGYVKTDMNQGEGELEVPDGARTSVRFALLPDDGPTGGFFHLDQQLPW